MKKIIANIWFSWKAIISVLYGILFITRGFTHGQTGYTMGSIILVLNGLLFLSMIYGAALLFVQQKKGLTLIAWSTLVNIVLAAISAFLIPGYYAYFYYCFYYVTEGYSGGLLMSVGPFVFSLIGLLISWGVSSVGAPRDDEKHTKRY